MGRPPDTILRIEGRPTSGTREPIGERLAVCFADGTLRVYGSRGEVLREWKPAEKGFVALAFSPDGRRLAGGAKSGNVVVLDAESGRTLSSFGAHRQAVEALALSKDGTVVASAAGPEAAGFRAAGSRLFGFTSPVAEVSAVAVAPTGELVAIALTDVDVRILDPVSGRVAVSVADFDMAPFCLAFSPDGRLLACGCADGTVSIRDAATGGRVRGDVRHAEPVAAVGFSPDGSRLVSVGLSMNPGTREASVRTTSVKGDVSSSDVLGVLPDVSLGFTRDGVAHVVSPGEAGARIWNVRG
jgi:WD40 repeat protein